MQIGIIGLGHMGRALAERLLDRGHDVTVHNRSPGPAEALVARGARAVTRPSEIWQHAPVALTLLSDDRALRAVVVEGEALDGASAADGCLIDCSTVSVDASRAVAVAAEQRGVGYLRCPVSGNPVSIASGALAVLASGDRALFERQRPVLEELGRRVDYVGDGEQARIVKLLLNLGIAATSELLAEMVLLGEAHGIDRDQLLDVASGSAIGSPFVGYKHAPLVKRDYTATFTTQMLEKDLGLVSELAVEQGVELPLAALLRSRTVQAISDGYGDLDLLGLLPSLQRRNGVTPDVEADPTPAD